PVRRPAGHRCHRPHRHQHPRRRPHAGGRHAARAVPAAVRAGGREAGRLGATAGPGRRAGGGGLEHERARPFPPRAALGAARRPRRAAADLPADRLRRPDPGHPGRHGRGRLRLHVPHVRGGAGRRRPEPGGRGRGRRHRGGPPHPRRGCPPAHRPAQGRGSLPHRRPAVLRRRQPPGQPAGPAGAQAQGVHPAYAHGADRRCQRRACPVQPGRTLPAPAHRPGAVGPAGTAAQGAGEDGHAAERGRALPGPRFRRGADGSRASGRHAGRRRLSRRRAVAVPPPWAILGRGRQGLATDIHREQHMRSGNPALNEKTFLDVGSGQVLVHDDKAMTLNGTVNKTGLLLLLVVLTASYTWSLFDPYNPGAVMPWIWGGAIGGFVVALVTVFKKAWAPFTAPLYDALEGLFVGALSAWFELQFPGIVMQAVMLTFGVLAALLLAYKSGLIKATENFKLGVVAATGGIALLYLVNIGMRLFGLDGFGFIHESGLLGIGFSVFVVIIAALNLVLDFDFIESGVEAGAPKYMEWYG